MGGGRGRAGRVKAGDAGHTVIECDVVIVGAGSAGSVMADRLSRSGEREVVLLEAGPDYVSSETPPELASTGPLALLGETDLTRTYMYPDLLASRSARQPATAYRRGRGVGGSSAINGLFAVRPTVADLDEWAQAGCEGWAFDRTLPLLKGMESDREFGHLDYHGDRGALPIRRPDEEEFTALDVGFRDACFASGHGWEPDHNAPGSTGVSPYAYNGRDGRRVSTNDAFLEPARARSNVRILGHTLVERCIFEGDRAVGVVAVSEGSVVEIRAGEVVLSAGAIHTPPILMRSGIGVAADLGAYGISVRVDLPVGKGLQDHPAVAVLIRLNEPHPSDPGRRHAGMCLRFDTGAGDERDGGMISACATEDPDIAAVIGWVNRVESIGRVRLNGSDPRLDPQVDFDMLSSPIDRRRMRRVVEALASLTRSPALRGAGEVLGLLRGVADGTTIAIEQALSDPDLDEMLLDAVFDVSHATSSCRMGSSEDPTTVVGPTGKVHGTENLRVADASILPWVPRANTHLSAVLAGEMIAADLAGAS